MEKQSRAKEGMPTSKEDKRKDKKPKSAKLFRKKSLKSVGSFMNRIIKTLGTFTHFGDTDAQDAEDDDGGFRNGAPCTLSASSGIFKDDAQVAKNPPRTSSSQNTGREKLLYHYGDKIPGVLGLKNHGNTCFMNAVVQCLSNTDLLAEYLGLERYKMDMGQSRINAVLKSDETRQVNGEVTEHLASLVRALWTLEYTPQLSVDFKVPKMQHNRNISSQTHAGSVEIESAFKYVFLRKYFTVSVATINKHLLFHYSIPLVP